LFAFCDEVGFAIGEGRAGWERWHEQEPLIDLGTARGIEVPGVSAMATADS
jgi:hypothetical protein